MYGELIDGYQGGSEYENRFGDNWEYMDEEDGITQEELLEMMEVDE